MLRQSTVSVFLLLAFPSLTAAQTRGPLNVAGLLINVVGDVKPFQLTTTVTPVSQGVDLLNLTLTSARPAVPPSFTLKWGVPSHDVAGHWMTGGVLNKTHPARLGGRPPAALDVRARSAGQHACSAATNRNVLTFAVSDALNTVLIGSGVREEDGLIYNEVVFFSERHEQLTEYDGQLRLDRRAVPY